MPGETRKQYIERVLEDFLKSSGETLKLNLYSNEIRKVEKDYDGKLVIEKGRRTAATADDKRYVCSISKKK